MGEVLRRGGRWAAVLAVLGVCALSAAGCAGATSGVAPPTATVTRGELTRTAAADGAFSGVTGGAGSVAVVPFTETEAGSVLAGQPARVIVTPVPGLSLPARVLAVAPDAVLISGVTNYYVSVVLTAGDPRLRAGQTVHVTVVTAALHNVLVVPNSAVIRQGSGRYVTVVGPDGQPTRVPFSPGAVGDEVTQVLGGLSEGQRVLLASPSGSG